MDRPRIAIIGAGNVASHLAPAFDSVGRVCQIMSRRIDNASALASRLRQCTPIDSLSQLDPNLDFYIIAAADDAIGTIAEAMPPVSGIVAHTSGSIPLQPLQKATPHCGVLYPLQTFSKTAAVDVAEVPMFVEGATPRATEALTSLAKSISHTVHHADSALRARLHLAAVFGCNFANNLWAIANDILRDASLDLSVLAPLLRATLDKALTMNPAKAQTGPAARRDFSVIAKQEAALQGIQKDIYSLLTKSILHTTNKYEQN